MIKKIDIIFFAGVVLLFLPFVISKEVFDFYIQFNKDHELITAFIKFAILATIGDVIGLRIKTGNYLRKGFGIIPRMIVWGFLGVTIKIAFVLFISYIFFPIFENMGFGHFNYIWQIARYHAETLSITLIIIGLTFIVNIEKNNKLEIVKILFSIILFSFSVLARPNFFPTSTIFTLYVILILYLNKNYNYILLVSIFYCISFLCLIHNIYFGNSFVLFTNTNLHFVFTDRFQELNLLDETNLIIQQIKKWNPLYNIHRLIILAIILYSVINYKHSLFTYALLFSVISQHGVLLLTHPDSRYAYLAWLLTFILFVKVEHSNKTLQQIFIKTKKLLI